MRYNRMLPGYPVRREHVQRVLSSPTRASCGGTLNLVSASNIVNGLDALSSAGTASRRCYPTGFGGRMVAEPRWNSTCIISRLGRGRYEDGRKYKCRATYLACRSSRITCGFGYYEQN